MAEPGVTIDATAGLLALLDRFAGRSALVVGDVMLDRYVRGQVDRISPEAPIPVLRVGNESEMPGGAGNAARNLAALGLRVTLVGATGTDAEAARLARALDAAGVMARLVAAADRPTTTKTRFLAGAQQLLRADREVAGALPETVAAEIRARADAALEACDVLILSDYGKGVLTGAVLRALIDRARALGKPVVVDPVGDDFARYRGADILKPNRREIAAATGIAAEDDAGAVAAAKRALDLASARAIALSRAEAGLSLVEAGGAVLHLPAEARGVFDVTGAGDSVVAVLAAGIAAGGNLGDAARLANIAGGIAVQQAGAVAVTRTELRRAVQRQAATTATGKEATADDAADIVAGWKRAGLKVGLTNGVFDLLHPGHLGLIAEARAACDKLVVAINADASVRRLKGDSRPIQSEATRALVLAALADVDLVVVFAEDTPEALLQRLRPDVLVKGGDYTIDQVVGAGIVRAYGGEVRLARLLPGHSTTATVAKIGG